MKVRVMPQGEGGVTASQAWRHSRDPQCSAGTWLQPEPDASQKLGASGVVNLCPLGAKHRARRSGELHCPLWSSPKSQA